jgi:hypothetical protein
MSEHNEPKSEADALHQEAQGLLYASAPDVAGIAKLRHMLLRIAAELTRMGLDDTAIMLRHDEAKLAIRQAALREED